MAISWVSYFVKIIEKVKFRTNFDFGDSKKSCVSWIVTSRVSRFRNKKLTCIDNPKYEKPWEDSRTFEKINALTPKKN